MDRQALASRMRLASFRATEELLRLIGEQKVGAYHLTGAAALLAKTAELLSGEATERTETTEGDSDALAGEVVSLLRRQGLELVVGGKEAG